MVEFEGPGRTGWMLLPARSDDNGTDMLFVVVGEKSPYHSLTADGRIPQ